MREFVRDQEVIIKFSSLYFGGIVALRPRRACGFTCVVLAGTSEGLADCGSSL